MQPVYAPCVCTCKETCIRTGIVADHSTREITRVGLEGRKRLLAPGVAPATSRRAGGGALKLRHVERIAK